MSFWKKLFKKTKKEQDKHHDEEMKYLKLLAKRMDKIENNLNKKNKKKKQFMSRKICIHCGKRKNPKSFAKHKNRTGGLDSRCKKCVKKHAKIRQGLHKKFQKKRQFVNVVNKFLKMADGDQITIMIITTLGDGHVKNVIGDQDIQEMIQRVLPTL